MKAHHIIISTISNGLRREILSIYLTIIIWAYNNCACYQDGGDDERREKEKNKKWHRRRLKVLCTFVRLLRDNISSMGFDDEVGSLNWP